MCIRDSVQDPARPRRVHRIGRAARVPLAEILGRCSGRLGYRSRVLPCQSFLEKRFSNAVGDSLILTKEAEQIKIVCIDGNQRGAQKRACPCLVALVEFPKVGRGQRLLERTSPRLYLSLIHTSDAADE